MQAVFSTTTNTARSELSDPAHHLNQISAKIRDSAFKIHRYFGPGLLEKAYLQCLFHDLTSSQHLSVEKEKCLPIHFEDLFIPDAYRIDLLVEKSVIIEIKAVQEILPIHQAQLLNYMKLGEFRLGYLINFNQRLLKDGIRRFAL